MKCHCFPWLLSFFFFPFLLCSRSLGTENQVVAHTPCGLALGRIRFCDSVAPTVDAGLTTLSPQTLQGRWEVSQGHTTILPHSVDTLRCASSWHGGMHGPLATKNIIELLFANHFMKQIHRKRIQGWAVLSHMHRTYINPARLQREM